MRAPRPANKTPLRARFGGFVHLLARRYMDYERAVLKAARRKRGKAVDVDEQHSKQGTGWALHWNIVGKNKLHDPLGHISKSAHISSLTDAQIARLRGPQGQRPHKLSWILRLANKHGVRVEVETKSTTGFAYWQRLADRWYVKALLDRGHVQVKTLAWMGDPVDRLKPAHDAGFPTILTFTGFGRRAGISKSRAWPYVDYVRGTGKWTA